MSGEFLMIYICNFHVLSNLLLIYICKLHWILKGIVRREDLRLSEVDKLVVRDCLRPGDIIHLIS